MSEFKDGLTGGYKIVFEGVGNNRDALEMLTYLYNTLEKMGHKVKRSVLVQDGAETVSMRQTVEVKPVKVPVRVAASTKPVAPVIEKPVVLMPPAKPSTALVTTKPKAVVKEVAKVTSKPQKRKVVRKATKKKK